MKQRWGGMGLTVRESEVAVQINSVSNRVGMASIFGL